MIPLRCFVTMLQKNEDDLLWWLRLNKITSSKIGNTWLVLTNWKLWKICGVL